MGALHRGKQIQMSFSNFERCDCSELNKEFEKMTEHEKKQILKLNEELEKMNHTNIIRSGVWLEKPIRINIDWIVYFFNNKYKHIRVTFYAYTSDAYCLDFRNEREKEREMQKLELKRRKWWPF